MTKQQASIRLQKYLSRAGVASRREAERLIGEGAVQVNGRTVTEMGYRVTPGRDRVMVGGGEVFPEKKRYFLLHKPAGYICSLKDGYRRPLATDLIKGVPERLYPVGRLDLDSEGLLLLSNDGDLCQKLTHPRYRVEKTYRVRLRYPPPAAAAARLRRGVVLEDGERTAPARLRTVSRDRKTVEVTIREGKKRQVKRMLLAVGNRVDYLKRMAVGPLELGSLKRGGYRPLSRKEVAALRNSAREEAG